MLTDEGTFVGVRQEDEDVDDLVADHVDENASDADPIEVAGSLAPSWDGYADEGGDHGYAASITSDVGEETLLVYGSASVEDLETVLGLLTLDPVASS
jgi:hypothetical protein